VIPGKQYKPEDFLRAVWRRRWMVIAPVLLAALAVAIWARSQPDEYRSETTLLIVPQSGADNLTRAADAVPIEDRLYTIRQQALSHSSLQQLIDDEGLYKSWRAAYPTGDAVPMLRQNVGIDIVKGNPRRVDGNYFTMSFISQEPETAARVANRLADLFVAENARDRSNAAQSAMGFIETQLTEARGKLEAQEKKVEIYRQRYASELPSMLLSNLEMLRKTQGQLQDLEDSLNADRARRVGLQGMIAAAEVQTQLPAANTPRTTAEAMGSSVGVQLEAARQELRALELRLTPEHPDVISARRRIATLEERARAEGVPASPDGGVLSPAELQRRQRLQELQGELASLDRQIADKERSEPRLQATIATYQAHVDAAPAHEAELTSLNRDVDTLQAVYQRLLASRENASISAQLETEQGNERFKVIEPARVPTVPFGPNRLRQVAMGALFGLGLGLGLVGMFEYRDSSLRTDADVVAALGFPVIAMIPEMRTAAQVTGRKRLQAVVSVLVLTLMASAIALMFHISS
jgi:protein tyrosine kinase modulator